jgi:predicted nucleic acid binding AN1-type Zn finger protein
MKRKLLLIKAIESHCRFRFSKLQILRMLSHDLNSLKKMARFVAKAEKITARKYPNSGDTLTRQRRKSA